MPALQSESGSTTTAPAASPISLGRCRRRGRAEPSQGCCPIVLGGRLGALVIGIDRVGVLVGGPVFVGQLGAQVGGLGVGGSEAGFGGGDGSGVVGHAGSLVSMVSGTPATTASCHEAWSDLGAETSVRAARVTWA